MLGSHWGITSLMYILNIATWLSSPHRNSAVKVKTGLRPSSDK
jgi:hypothetical protein